MQIDFYRCDIIEVMAMKFRFKDIKKILFLFIIISVCIWPDIIYENI